MSDDMADSNKKTSVEAMSSNPEADREGAAQAHHEFGQAKYAQCLSTLKTLTKKRSEDSKVTHNFAVAEYYLSDCKKTERFNRSMAEVCQLAHVDVRDLDTMDDVDNCIVLYNQAVVLYHLHQYHAAINILDKVFQYIEPLEESLAKNICFLLLESYLCIYQPKKALSLVGYMETLSGSKNCSKSNNKDKENQREENGGENGMSEAFKRRLQLCKARCYAMIKTSKACKREIKNLMSSGSTAQNIPAFYLKSQLEYQRGNYRKALKLLNSVTLPGDLVQYFRDTGDFLPVIFYNNVGCIHFYMGKPSLGRFYIDKALDAFNAEMTSLTDASATNKLDSRPLHLMSVSTSHQLVYNLGMQYLQARKFREAFSCFTQAAKSYHSNPRLWLRIAECCIHIHRPDSTDQYVEYKKKPLVKAVVGAGPHRKVILNSSSEKTPEDPKQVKAGKDPSPTMHFGMLCLKNALFLVGNQASTRTEDALANLQSEEGDAEETLSTLPSNFIQGPEIQSLRNSVLVASSYTSLCLGDIIPALSYAKTLLSQPRVSSAHKFLANLYAGESLLLMDRITEAVEHLSFQIEGEIELASPVNSSELSLKHQARFDSKLSEKSDDGSRPVGNVPNWMPDAISTAGFVAQYNLAVAYAVREEWNKSLECLLQMNPSGNVPSQAVSLLLYVQSHQGSAEETKSYVKRYNLPGQA